MVDVNIEVARACLVIGLVFTAFFYSRTRLVSGGAITGSYIAFILLTGQWFDVVGWLVLSLVGMFAIRIAANYWPLSRTWLYYLGIIVPATIHTILVYVAHVPDFAGFSAYLVAGLYVTNGLTAYDMQRQGVFRTLAAIAMVVVATLAVVLPINLGMNFFSQSQYELNYFTITEPALILICILAAAAVHLSLGWGTAGIIGALFLVDILNWQSILLIVAITGAGAWIAKRVSNKLALTPRQRLYAILVVASIASWFGLFWLDYLGLSAAQFQSEFGVETLLVIGLMINEIIKVGATRAYGGAGIVLLLTAAANWAFNTGGATELAVLAGVAIVIIALFGYAIRQEHAKWNLALEAGAKWRFS